MTIQGKVESRRRLDLRKGRIRIVQAPKRIIVLVKEYYNLLESVKSVHGILQDS